MSGRTLIPLRAPRALWQGMAVIVTIGLPLWAGLYWLVKLALLAV